ncbi:MAG: hypothetical protein ACI8V2_001277 [Candidatus Latescibacterota bacterium]|jgi:hypothetical protein
MMPTLSFDIVFLQKECCVFFRYVEDNTGWGRLQIGKSKAPTPSPFLKEGG